MMRATSPGEEHVDWIEELFGLSPDAGSGTLEALIAGSLVAVILAVIFTVRARNARPTEKRR